MEGYYHALQLIIQCNLMQHIAPMTTLTYPFKVTKHTVFYGGQPRNLITCHFLTSMEIVKPRPNTSAGLVHWLTTRRRYR